MSQFTTDSDAVTQIDAGEQLVHEVVSAVATAEGVDPCDLSPLYSAIDPDALERLLSTGDRAGGAALEVTFEYHGYDVTVTPDATVELSAL